MFECPNCGSNLRFDISSQQLACPSCNSHFDPYSITKDKDAVETKINDDTFKVTIFTCPQCAGEIYGTDETAAAFCSFCGASTILTSRLSEEKRPDYIIPFAKTKEDCKDAYIKLMRSAIFAPKELKDRKSINEFRGIYMPYWVYHIKHDGLLNLKGKKSYRKGDYIYEDIYQISGVVDCDYNGITFDASSSFEDEISEKIAPFDVKEMKEFTPAFLSGFYADTSDVAHKIYDEDAELAASKNTERYVRCDSALKGYEITTKDKRFMRMLPKENVSIETAMFPVWFMSYQKNGRVAYATVNGQTGKVVADILVDIKKYLFGSFLLAIPIYLFLNAAFTIKPTILLFAVSIIALFSMILHAVETNAIYRKDSLLDDKGAMSKKKTDRKNVKKDIKKDVKKDVKKNKSGLRIAVISFSIFGFLIFATLFDISADDMGWLIVLGIALVICIVEKKEYKEIEQNKKIPGYAGSFVAIVLATLILLINPVRDIFYYAGSAVALVAVFFTLYDLIKKYNISATRKLPQFERTGGDDHAE